MSLLTRFLTDKFKRVQDVSDKIDNALIPYLLGPGDLFFVDNTNGSNSRTGRDMDKAFSTLNYAVSQASAYDVIIMVPWHAETIEDTGTASGTVTDECAIDVAGVKIIGLGHGLLRPTFTLEGAVDAAITILAGATNVLLRNIIVKSNLADVAAGITLSATSDGAIIEDCILRDGAAAKELVIGINVAADCDDITIRRNVITTVPAGGCASAIAFAGGSDRCVIEDNVCEGTYSASAFDVNAAASLNMIVRRNVFANQGAAAAELHATCTGIFANNYVAGTTSIAAALTGVDLMWLFENYVTGEDNKSGLLDPGADADA